MTFDAIYRLCIRVPVVDLRRTWPLQLAWDAWSRLHWRERVHVSDAPIPGRRPDAHITLRTRYATVLSYALAPLDPALGSRGNHVHGHAGDSMEFAIDDRSFAGC